MIFNIWKWDIAGDAERALRWGVEWEDLAVNVREWGSFVGQLRR